MSSSTQDTDDVVDAASLIRRIAAGELGALEVLFDRHARSAYALAGRVMGDRGFAADAVLDVFVSLWDTPGEDRHNLPAWIHEAIHRHAVDTLRRERALRTRRTEAVRDAARLRDIPGALRLSQREVLVLAYLGGYTLREVATLTHQPLAAVRQELRVAIGRLVSLLAGPGDGSVGGGPVGNPGSGSVDGSGGEPGDEPSGDGDHLAEEALAAGSVVHALEPDEEVWFAEHLPACSRCRSSVLRGQVALARLAAALPSQEPVPADLWSTLESRIEAGRQPGAPSVAATEPAEVAGHEVEGSQADDGAIEGVASAEGLQRVMVWLGLAMFLVLGVAIGAWYVAFRG